MIFNELENGCSTTSHLKNMAKETRIRLSSLGIRLVEPTLPATYSQLVKLRVLEIACYILTGLSIGDPARPTVDPFFPPIAGLALFSVPWWFDVKKPLRRKIIGQYYGTDVEEKWEVCLPSKLD